MDNSPGVPLDPADALACSLYAQAQRVGWELLASLRQIELSRWDAEALLLRLDYLTRQDLEAKRDHQQRADEIAAALRVLTGEA